MLHSTAEVTKVIAFQSGGTIRRSTSTTLRTHRPCPWAPLGTDKLWRNNPTLPYVFIKPTSSEDFLPNDLAYCLFVLNSCPFLLALRARCLEPTKYSISAWSKRRPSHWKRTTSAFGRRMQGLRCLEKEIRYAMNC